jgi:hypothetical protein
MHNSLATAPHLSRSRVVPSSQHHVLEPTHNILPALMLWSCQCFIPISAVHQGLPHLHPDLACRHFTPRLQNALHWLQVNGCVCSFLPMIEISSALFTIAVCAEYNLGTYRDPLSISHSSLVSMYLASTGGKESTPELVLLSNSTTQQRVESKEKNCICVERTGCHIYA